jgi:hypothetical protein
LGRGTVAAAAVSGGKVLAVEQSWSGVLSFVDIYVPLAPPDRSLAARSKSAACVGKESVCGGAGGIRCGAGTGGLFDASDYDGGALPTGTRAAERATNSVGGAGGGSGGGGGGSGSQWPAGSGGARLGASIGSAGTGPSPSYRQFERRRQH